MRRCPKLLTRRLKLRGTRCEKTEANGTSVKVHDLRKKSNKCGLIHAQCVAMPVGLNICRARPESSRTIRAHEVEEEMRP